MYNMPGVYRKYDPLRSFKKEIRNKMRELPTGNNLQPVQPMQPMTLVFLPVNGDIFDFDFDLFNREEVGIENEDGSFEIGYRG